MVYERGAALGAIMLATGLLSAWSSYPAAEGGGIDTDPGVRTTLAFSGAILVTLVGAAVLILSLLD